MLKTSDAPIQSMAKGSTPLIRGRPPQLGRESMYKSLSEPGNLELRTLNKLLHAMSMRLSVVPDQPHV